MRERGWRGSKRCRADRQRHVRSGWFTWLDGLPEIFHCRKALVFFERHCASDSCRNVFRNGRNELLDWRKRIAFLAHLLRHAKKCIDGYCTCEKCIEGRAHAI